MNLEAIRALLTRHPFEALRVKSSSGEVFEICHPEMAMIARSALCVVHPEVNGTPSDKVEYISYLHIASIETITGANVR